VVDYKCIIKITELNPIKMSISDEFQRRVIIEEIKLNRVYIKNIALQQPAEDFFTKANDGQTS